VLARLRRLVAMASLGAVGKNDLARNDQGEDA
jgi:hypothetical protein